MNEQSIDFALGEGLLVDRKWLKAKGFDRPAVDYYLRSGKLVSFARGIYRKPGPPLKWQNIVYSLTILGYRAHVGHISALGFFGFQHFLSLSNKEEIHIYSDRALPPWLGHIDGNITYSELPRNPFRDSVIGITEVPFGTWDWPIPFSTPERAYLEMLSTVSKVEHIQGALLMMESAAGFRPDLVQTLLKECNQVKAKRLFLWMAREQNHDWYRHINRARLDLGQGKRQVVVGGKLDEEFQITVPRGPIDGQAEPIF